MEIRIDPDWEKLPDGKTSFSGIRDQGFNQYWISPSAKSPGRFNVDSVIGGRNLDTAYCEGSRRPMTKEGLLFWIKKIGDGITWSSYPWDGEEHNPSDTSGSRKRESTTTIYFIEAVGTGFVKIGRGSGRVNQLQTGCPYELRVIVEVEGTIEEERQLHAHFAKDCERGEWFRMSREIKSYIEKIRGGITNG